MDKGILYVVSTPIGNLADMTYRAVDTLKTVDIIASEDTRHTGILLKHYGIQTKQIAYHDFNKEKVTPGLIEQLESGFNIAAVSDAGTPGVSDPGFYLVRECLKRDIEIVPIPGASALLAGLVVSGLPTDRFCFEGFLPKSSGKLKKRLAELKSESRTIIIFESPHRVAKILGIILEIFGDRRAYLGRELTKKFEQHYRQDISSLIAELKQKPPKGELVLILEGNR
jgi:16S rRNA (cytidine1402-2'-O)-methyltransferase